MTDQFCCDWAIPLVDPAGDVMHPCVDEGYIPANAPHPVEAEELGLTKKRGH